MTWAERQWTQITQTFPSKGEVEVVSTTLNATNVNEIRII